MTFLHGGITDSYAVEISISKLDSQPSMERQTSFKVFQRGSMDFHVYFHYLIIGVVQATQWNARIRLWHITALALPLPPILRFETKMH